VLVMISSLEGGGSERQALLVLRRLNRTIFAPELYVLRRSGSLLGQVPADVPIHCFEESIEAETASWLSWPGRVHGAQVGHLARLLTNRSIDVIYDRTFHMSLIAAPAAVRCEIPRVATIVSPPSRALPLNGGKFLAIKRRRLRAAYRQASAVITVSHPTASDAARYYGLPRSRFTVIPNPVDAEAIDSVVARFPRPSRDGRYTIACVGRMSAEKGQAELLKAVDRLLTLYPEFPPPKFWMIGDGPLRESLQQAVERSKWQEHFEFLGHLEHPEPWIAAADALCVPSHFEGFPNVMLEAMALGVPVIARSLDVTRSLGRLPTDPAIRGRDYLATYVDSPSQSGVALARRLRRVKLNPTATQSRVAAALRLARETLSPVTIIPRIEQALIEAIKGRH